MASSARFQTLSVSSESRRAIRNTDQQRKDRAQGNQESIGRQDETAELEEMRVHRSQEEDETDPLGRAAVRR